MNARRIATLVLAAAGIGSLLHCSGPRSGRNWETTADLTQRFAVAEVSAESGRIDFGASQARSSLISGWSEDQVGREGQRFVVSTNERSELRFTLTWVRDLPLSFNCRPLNASAWNGMLTIGLNGAPLTSIALERGTRSYSLILPAESLVQGENRLELGYGGERSVQPDGHPPRVRWLDMEIGTTGSRGAEPFADSEKELLFIPPNARIAFPVVAGPGSQLWMDRVDIAGEAPAQLVVEAIDDSGAAILDRLSSARDLVAIDLERAASDAFLLSLRAESAEAGLPGDGFYLARPTIRTPGPTPPPPAASLALPTSRPDILVYLVDTLRVDRLSTYGYEKPTSPQLDDFAARATLFEKAVGQSSWTRPSVASLFVGSWPAAHSVIRRRDALAGAADTLAETLQRSGYRTAAFSLNANISKDFGFGQGFDHFELLPENSPSTEANLAVSRWLESTPMDEPFFLYVQTADPHAPYLPPEPFRSRLAPDAEAIYERVAAAPEREIWDSDPETVRGLNALYDAEIAANDASFGALLDRLEKIGLLDQMLVIFLSDHGEEFRERGGWTHGRNLHTETLDFPLLIKAPGQRTARRVSEVVQHIDITTTVTDLLDLEPPTAARGRSLAAYLATELPVRPLLPPRPVFSHVSLVRGVQTSIVVGEWKLMDRQESRGRTSTLYRWTEDPGETKDLARQMPIRTRALRALLDEKLAATDKALGAEEAVLSPEIEERLRALGYL